MVAWKNGQTSEQVARSVLRSFLIRCHRIVSQDYPEFAAMSAVDSADFILHLRDTGRISLRLENQDASRIRCRITYLTTTEAESGSAHAD